MTAPPTFLVGDCDEVSKHGDTKILWKPEWGFVDFIELLFSGSIM